MQTSIGCEREFFSPFSRSRVRDISLAMAVATAYHWNIPMAVAGMVLTMAGIVLQTWSKAALRRNKQLNSKGPYALCRHPFYLGNFLFDIGLCSLSGNIWLVGVYPLIFTAGHYSTFRHEERILRGLFGDGHIQYCRSTPLLRPDLKGLFRHWRAPCSWQVLAKERQISRAIRLSAYPLALTLAARTWHRPVSVFDGASLTLLMVVGALALLSRFVYGSIEKPSARSIGTDFAALVVRWGTLISAVLPLVLALALEQDTDDVLLSGCFSLAALGLWGCLNPFAPRAPLQARNRLAVALAQSGILACGLWINQMLWLVPLPMALLLAGVLFRRPATGLSPELPLRVVRVAGAAMLTVGVASMAFATPAFPGLTDPVSEAVHRVVGPGDRVTVLNDRDFAVYGEEEWLGQFATLDDLTLRLDSPVARETFLLVDPDDLRDLRLRMPDRLHLEVRIRSWFDEYHLYRVLDTPKTLENLSL